MIKSPFNNRYRDRRSAASQSGPRGRRDASARRESGPRREFSTVVHPWMSLPEKLAATQLAMRELAGTAAFQCPMDDTYIAPEAKPVEEKPRPSAVNIVFRKRRLPADRTVEVVS